MLWNKTKLESNLSSYEYKGIRLDELFRVTKKLLLDQISKDEIDMCDEMIPEEGDKYQIIPPESIGTLGLDPISINSTIDCLNEYEEAISKNIEKQTLFIHKLKNDLDKAYKSSTDFPYVLHAIIIHEGEAMSGHYYSYVRDHLSGHWYKFNDHMVKKYKNKTEEIIEEGIGSNTRSAYFLVYINKKHILPKTRKVRFLFIFRKTQFLTTKNLHPSTVGTKR
jgi:hypothetical protein